MEKEKVFADGFSFKRRENAPEFVVGRLSIKVEDALAFLKDNASNGWVNININQARSGNHYCELDTWKPNTDAQSKTESVKEEKEELTF